MGKRAQRGLGLGWLLGWLAASLLIAGCNPGYDESQMTLEAARSTATYAETYLHESELTQAVYATKIDEAYQRWKQEEQTRLNREAMVPWALVCLAIGFAGLIFAVIIPRAVFLPFRVQITSIIRRNEARLEHLNEQKRQLEDELDEMGISPDKQE